MRTLDLLEISHETIYSHVWRDKKRGGKLHLHLRQPFKRRKRYGSYERRGRVGGKRHISERPSIVESRSEIGHWEMDTVIGAADNHCVVSLVERATGAVLIGKRRRVLLILLDIASFAACYAIVARITLSGDARALTTAAIRWSITYATLVEFLRAVWCFIALNCLRIESASDRQTREPWLRSWFCVNTVSFVIGTALSVAAWLTLRPGTTPVPVCLAWSTVIISLASFVAYLAVMRAHYIRRRAT